MTTTDLRPPTPPQARRYDPSHGNARTRVGETWDGCFQARCAWGRIVTWLARPGRQPKPQCTCRRRR